MSLVVDDGHSVMFVIYAGSVGLLCPNMTVKLVNEEGRGT